MATRPIGIGAAGERLAENLEQQRRSRQLSQAELSACLSELGRPMASDSISKIESKSRRADTADILALSLALETTPNRLLIGPSADEEKQIELSPAKVVSAGEAWRWAAGHAPLPNGREIRDEAEFITANNPQYFGRHARPLEYLSKAAEIDKVRVYLVSAVESAFESDLGPEVIRELLERAIVNALYGRAY